MSNIQTGATTDATTMTEETGVKTKRDGTIGGRMTVMFEITAETTEGILDGETRGIDGTRIGITTRTGGKERGTEMRD